MYGFGGWELVIILIIFGILLLPIIVTIILRKKFPNKIWLGLLLSFIFAPIGQLYLSGAAIYIIVLVLIEITVQVMFGVGGIVYLLSPALMYYRFSKRIR